MIKFRFKIFVSGSTLGLSWRRMFQLYTRPLKQSCINLR